MALEGRYEFYCDGIWVPLEIGSPRLSPRGTYHAFRNVGDAPGRIMLMTNGGGIDEYFRAIANLRMPEDVERLHEVSAHYGYVFLPQSVA